MNEIQSSLDQDLSVNGRAYPAQSDLPPIEARTGAETRLVLCKECGAEITTARNCKSKRAGLCRACFRRSYDREYRHTHRERYRLYAQRYYQTHGQQLRHQNTERKRGWRDTHRAEYRAYQREYKRRMRGTFVDGDQQGLPERCTDCGADISQKWATKARRAGFCSACYERQTRSRQYQRAKSRRESLAAATRDVEVLVSPQQVPTNGHGG
ncbi:MAG: hypothetical protein EPO21_16320 [Chloroflexota bacterium]|nr:MAG: hypothetical protein EPO21_16320 [Chloroflexota bacterium]